MDNCTCGIPNKANWYIHVIFTKEDETTYTDMYVCNTHYTTNTRELLNWDNNVEWEIIEHTDTELR